jgi:putative ABC transport system substrate-binding protein
MMNRRKFLMSFAAGALAAPSVLFAQQQRTWRIGILSPRSKPSTWDNDLFGAFFKGLRDLGYIEGKNIKIDARFSEGKIEPLQQLAAELVELKVDVIVTVGTPPVRAAQRATSSIPIVAASFADPVASGFAASLSHPGGNITGVSNLGEDMYAKRLEMLMAIAPKITRIAWLVNPDNAATMRLVPGMETVAKKKGKDLLLINARKLDEVEEAFSTMAQKHVGGVIVADDGVLIALGSRIAELALRHKLPSIFAQGHIVDAGGLMSYGLDLSYTYDRVATFVDKIFKGAKPGDLPIEQPTKLELVINAKTANAIGITIPEELRLRADKVIE